MTRPREITRWPIEALAGLVLLTAWGCSRADAPRIEAERETGPVVSSPLAMTPDARTSEQPDAVGAAGDAPVRTEITPSATPSTKSSAASKCDCTAACDCYGVNDEARHERKRRAGEVCKAAGIDCKCGVCRAP